MPWQPVASKYLQIRNATNLQAVVSPEEAIAMARKLGLKFYRTCVKEDLNVTEGGLEGRVRQLSSLAKYSCIRILHRTTK